MNNSSRFNGVLSEQKIIEKIKHGELEHFEYIVNSYTKHIMRYIAARLFDKNDTDDIVQNTFIKFYKALNRFDNNRPVLPYLFEIAKNELKMYFRSHKTTVSLEEVAHTTAQKEKIKTDPVNELLESLSAVEQKALQLVGEGYSYQEIAQKIKKTLTNTKTIIRRARIKLKQKNEKRN